MNGGYNPYLSPWGPSQGPGPGPDLTSGLVINPILARSSSERYCVYFQDAEILESLKKRAPISYK